MKTVQNSLTTMTQMILPNDTNPLGNLLGGKLMHWIDIAAALSARKHSGKVCVTASVDEISFIEPIKLGDTVILQALVNRVFTTSLEIGVKVFREDPINDTRKHTASAYLTFVAIDNYGRPVKVAPIKTETEEEQRRYEEAEVRRRRRLETREHMESMRAQPLKSDSTSS